MLHRVPWHPHHTGLGLLASEIQIRQSQQVTTDRKQNWSSSVPQIHTPLEWGDPGWQQGWRWKTDLPIREVRQRIPEKGVWKQPSAGTCPIAVPKGWWQGHLPVKLGSMPRQPSAKKPSPICAPFLGVWCCLTFTSGLSLDSLPLPPS